MWKNVGEVCWDEGRGLGARPPRGGAEGVAVRGPGDIGKPGVQNCQV